MVVLGDFSTTLLDTLSPCENVRIEAERNLKRLEQDLPLFLHALSSELATEPNPIASRRLAGILLKNYLHSDDPVIKKQLVQQWVSIDVLKKKEIKQLLWDTLGSIRLGARRAAAQVIAKIAYIEIPRDEWPNLIDMLLSNLNRPWSLEILGFIFEDMSHQNLQRDRVLTEILQCMTSVVYGVEIRLAATKALYNALHLATRNFGNDRDRNRIIKVVCETAESDESEIRQAAFECLVSVSSTYYHLLEPHSSNLLALTSKAVLEDNYPAVALQAIELWSSICDVEIKLQQDEEDSNKQTQKQDFNKGTQKYPVINFRIIGRVMHPLVSMLLETLSKPEEDQDDDVWTLFMAAATCLGLVAKTVGDAVFRQVLEFLKKTVAVFDRQLSKAAVYAFVSVLKLTPLVNEGQKLLLNYMKGVTPGSSSWMGSLEWILHTMHTRKEFLPVMNVFLDNIKDVPYAEGKVYHAICFMTESSVLSPYHPHLKKPESLKKPVLIKIDRADKEPYISNKLLPVIMNELKQTADDRVKQGDTTQARFCVVLQTIIQILSSTEKTKPIILQAADQMMMLFLKLFPCSPWTVHKEAMFAIKSLARATGVPFEKYMSRLSEISHQDLRKDEVNSVVVAVAKGMTLADHGVEFRLAATKALYNTLDFAQTNFANEKCRHYIMEVIYKTAQSKESEVKEAAFKCLVSISATYYMFLQPHMHDLLQLTSKAVREDKEPVAVQAIEIWSSICNEEIKLQEYQGESGDSASHFHFHLIKNALSSLVPMLLETLLKREENQARLNAGGKCIRLVANTVGAAVLQFVMPFVQKNMTHSDWHFREAAMHAIACVLQDPSIEDFIPFINQINEFDLQLPVCKSSNVLKEDDSLKKVVEELSQKMTHVDTLSDDKKVLDSVEGFKDRINKIVLEFTTILSLFGAFLASSFVFASNTDVPCKHRNIFITAIIFMCASISTIFVGALHQIHETRSTHETIVLLSQAGHTAAGSRKIIKRWARYVTQPIITIIAMFVIAISFAVFYGVTSKYEKCT